MTTLRQQIMILLENGPQDLRSLSQAAGISEKEAAAHLPHIEKTLRQKGISLATTPYRCRVCGFVFQDRHRFSKPGRCPVCKNGSLEPATYRIETK
jgi:transcriptional regulator